MTYVQASYMAARLAPTSHPSMPEQRIVRQGAVRTMYKIVAHFADSADLILIKSTISRLADKKSVIHRIRLMFRIIRYLTERVSERSCKNEPIAQITDLRSDMLLPCRNSFQLAACKLRLNLRCTARLLRHQPHISQALFRGWLMRDGVRGRSGLVPN